MPDSTLIPTIGKALVLFGIPVGWLALAVTVVIGWVNTIKALAPQLIQSAWYPAVALALSFGYAWSTLNGSWQAVVAGSLGLFVVQWLAWIAAKKTAVATGLRDK